MNKPVGKHLQHFLSGCLVVLGLLAAANVFAEDQGVRDPREFFFTQSFGDMPEELAIAKKQGKQGIFLFFEAEGCSYLNSGEEQ